MIIIIIYHYHSSLSFIINLGCKRRDRTLQTPFSHLSLRFTVMMTFVIIDAVMKFMITFYRGSVCIVQCLRFIQTELEEINRISVIWIWLPVNFNFFCQQKSLCYQILGCSHSKLIFKVSFCGSNSLNGNILSTFENVPQFFFQVSIVWYLLAYLPLLLNCWWMDWLWILSST